MPERDGMPSTVAEWNQLDVATEMAYRRGFTHAMQVTINAMKAGHPAKEAVPASGVTQ